MIIGDYVRTPRGIGIFRGYNSNKNSNWKNKIEFRGLKNLLNCSDEYIKKSSSNLIDIVEIGDIVNGYKVTDVMVNKDCEIKEIVTHEQYEEYCFRV